MPLGASTLVLASFQELLEALWDEDRWGAGGVALEDFAGPGGLARRLLDAMPEARASGSQPGTAQRLSVEEALAKARASDYQRLGGAVEWI